MTYAFGREAQQRLEMFAWANVLLAFDFDGTLAPLTASPGRAAMRASTRRLLKQICRLYPSVVISGRSRADVRSRLRGVDLCQIVGNHGSEPWLGSAAIQRRIRTWVPTLRRQLAGEPGVVIEDKGFSVAVHYRASSDRSAARRAILAATKSLGAVRVVGGELAVNLLDPHAPDKGVALDRQRDHLACDHAIYVGDDDTDEDVFRLKWPPERLFTVRVGRKAASAAAFYLRTQAEIDRLLEKLIELRTPVRSARSTLAASAGT
ncbi:MAG TPA: trehalose-phosphatase [Vicinamibacterales bacterium]|nr:trehalose-phosphatase [Vicinamibacterales bacterium]